MKAYCLFLMGVIGFGLFFWMMIGGWGLSVKSWWPIVIYYIWWFVSMVVRLVAIKIDEKGA